MDKKMSTTLNLFYYPNFLLDKPSPLAKLARLLNKFSSLESVVFDFKSINRLATVKFLISSEEIPYLVANSFTLSKRFPLTSSLPKIASLT